MASSIVTWFPEELSDVEVHERAQMLLGNVTYHTLQDSARFQSEGHEEDSRAARFTEAIVGNLLNECNFYPARAEASKKQ